MRFFLDANMPYSSKDVFKNFGLVNHAGDIGLARATDREIIEYATERKAILVTKDLEFANVLIYPINSHSGVVVLKLPFYFTAKQINNALKEFLSPLDVKELENAVTIVELGRYRMRR
jgi:predicted nuclease of predicted toxin-antitoxin system